MELRVHDLACRRGEVTVIEGLNFRLAPGDCLVLRGPNGSGKTTLLRTLAGLAPPAAGRIELDEDAILYAGHADGIKAQLTVAENLAFWARVYGGADIAPALAAFRLGDLRDRQAQHLSAGQKRRLGLARLKVCPRPVWALDEPTVSLDRETVATFADVVADHCTAGGSAIIATHVDLGIAGTRLLDIAPFRAREDGDAGSPFLDAAFDAEPAR
ncbi:heme ABC exporter ATP-binding protein CcmA [Maritimibacter sp. 55A14]|uniref:heme ABC exporter ATP-binding protein CcmA n=1 Tax=Maritimibacter sp. 55A14 TaxID=2174844 RepID=UPI000D6185F1|nr:heme ABC exporter ATP-binding protein CcmA [Maritimibacter sp. 55A14]PWE34406.1 heme ABC exporter ATP-binding protein CcmA [Maritimibacter sp. 55A14]